MKKLWQLLRFLQMTLLVLALNSGSNLWGADEAPGLMKPGASSTDVSIGAPSLEINAPSTENFLKSGRRVFPSNVQAPSEAPNLANVDARETSEDYPVGPGDQVLINFWGRIDDAIIVSINSDRKLFIPRIGVLDTKGMTFAELREAISKSIQKALKNVQFAISLYGLREFMVYVLGEVNNPRPVRARANVRASEVLAQAGIRPTGSQQFIEIRRGDKVFRVDLLKFQTSADFSLNPYVSDNDVIFVPSLKEFVTVSGAVLRPGTFEIRESRKLSEVISQMGGLSIYADRTAPIKISRMNSDGSRSPVMVAIRSESGGSSLDGQIETFNLKHGDEIFIPSSNLLIPSKSNSVFITGEVKNPGPIPYQISTSLEEYIGFAGGLSPRANLAAGVVYKSDGSMKPLSPRAVIEPGDTIYIPEKTFKFWQDHLTIVTAFISLATSIIVLSGR